VAPFAGVITRRYADTGAMIQAGTSSQTQSMPVVRLSQNYELRLVIPVPESAVARVRIGDPVSLRVDALGRTLTGTVARFSDRLNEDTRTMQVEVDVKNDDLSLVPGMYANASLTLDRADGVLVAPLEAIDRADTSATALVVGADKRLVQKKVSLGLEDGGRVAVTDGLSDGDLLVVGNRSQLKPGMTVTTRAMPAPAAEGSH
jgi:RND family efflux transporter MFP subunit